MRYAHDPQKCNVPGVCRSRRFSHRIYRSLSNHIVACAMRTTPKKHRARSARYGCCKKTVPFSTLLATVFAQPTSGATACPSSKQIFHACNGQVTFLPDTMPCDSGPPLCGHLSCSANTSLSAVRNSAMFPRSVFTTREPSNGMSWRFATLCHLFIIFFLSAIKARATQIRAG